MEVGELLFHLARLYIPFFYNGSVENCSNLKKTNLGGRRFPLNNDCGRKGIFLKMGPGML